MTRMSGTVSRRRVRTSRRRAGLMAMARSSQSARPGWPFLPGLSACGRLSFEAAGRPEDNVRLTLVSRLASKASRTQRRRESKWGQCPVMALFRAIRRPLLGARGEKVGPVAGHLICGILSEARAEPGQVVITARESGSESPERLEA